MSQPLGDHHRRVAGAEAHVDAVFLAAQSLDQVQHGVGPHRGHLAESARPADVDHLDGIFMFGKTLDAVALGDSPGEILLPGRQQQQVVAPGPFPEQRIDPFAGKVASAPLLAEPLGDRRRRAFAAAVVVGSPAVALLAQVLHEAATDGEDDLVALFGRVPAFGFGHRRFSLGRCWHYIVLLTLRVRACVTRSVTSTSVTRPPPAR